MNRLTEMAAFAAVVDHGGFTDAARAMGMSKSAVSKHVSALEARLGARLLSRTTRRVNPTEIGLTYYDRARRVLNDAGEADAMVAASQAAPTGELRVAASPDFAVRHLAPTLPGFLAKYPALDVVLEVAPRRADPVADGFDAVIRLDAAEEPGVHVHKVAETAMRLVAAPAYLARAGRPARIDDLPGHRLLHQARGSAGVWRLRAPSCELREVRGAPALVANDPRCLLEAVIAGAGIALLPEHLYADAAREGLVEEAMPTLPIEPRSLSVVYPATRVTAPKLRVFVDHLVATFGDRRAGGW
jgi:DNA-binding transcriptional LysR family regulator